MRKYLLLSASLFIAHNIFSQNRMIDIYCKINSNTLFIEFGGLQKILPDSVAKQHLFHPGRKVPYEIGVVNFMSLNGWKLVNSTIQREGSSYETTYLMKKEIEITPADFLQIMDRYEKMKK